MLYISISPDILNLTIYVAAFATYLYNFAAENCYWINYFYHTTNVSSGNRKKIQNRHKLESRKDDMR